MALCASAALAAVVSGDWPSTARALTGRGWGPGALGSWGVGSSLRNGSAGIGDQLTGSLRRYSTAMRDMIWRALSAFLSFLESVGWVGCVCRCHPVLDPRSPPPPPFCLFLSRPAKLLWKLSKCELVLCGSRAAGGETVSHKPRHGHPSKAADSAESSERLMTANRRESGGRWKKLGLAHLIARADTLATSQGGASHEPRLALPVVLHRTQAGLLGSWSASRHASESAW